MTPRSLPWFNIMYLLISFALFATNELLGNHPTGPDSISQFVAGNDKVTYGRGTRFVGLFLIVIMGVWAIIGVRQAAGWDQEEGSAPPTTATVEQAPPGYCVLEVDIEAAYPRSSLRIDWEGSCVFCATVPASDAPREHIRLSRVVRAAPTSMTVTVTPSSVSEKGYKGERTLLVDLDGVSRAAIGIKLERYAPPGKRVEVSILPSS